MSLQIHFDRLGLKNNGKRKFRNNKQVCNGEMHIITFYYLSTTEDC